MAHDVFISHSSKDKVMADAICAGLEARGIRCWIAPRDIAPGRNYAGQLFKAIENCKVFLVVLTGNSLLSTHILKEVELAVQSGNAILPFRLQDIPLSDDLKYYLGNVHWLDALTPPVEKHIGILADYIQRILDAQSIKSDIPIEQKASALIAEPVEIPHQQVTTISKKKHTNFALLIGLGLLAVAIVVGAVIIGNKLVLKSQSEIPNDQLAVTYEPSPTFTAMPTQREVTSSPQIKASATPVIITGVLLNNANCYETSRDNSPSVETVLKGTKVIVLGENSSGDWVNLKYEGLKHFYHDQNTFVPDCWMFKSNLEIQGQTSPFLIFTPRPATHQIWKIIITGSRPDGSTYGNDFENADKSAGISQADVFCNDQISFGNTCTYTVTITYIW